MRAVLALFALLLLAPAAAFGYGYAFARHGAHHVTITARPVGAPAQSLRLTALRR